MSRFYKARVAWDDLGQICHLVKVTCLCLNPKPGRSEKSELTIDPKTLLQIDWLALKDNDSFMVPKS